MFKTIRSQIVILIIGLMVVTLMTFIFITTRNYQAEITVQNYRLAKETLAAATRIIETEYNDLLSYKINSINNHRSMMENTGVSILSIVNSFYDLQIDGILTEQAAKEKCLNRLKNTQYNKNYCFVYDLELTGLSHPKEEMIGKKWSGFEDIRKRDALSLMREIVQTEQKGFTLFWWPRSEDMKLVKQIGFFVYYPQWKWIIGIAHEVDEIEKISIEKENQTLAKLNDILGRMDINERGGILIFDNQGKVIIHTSKLKKIIHSTGKVLNKSLTDYLTKAYKNRGAPVEYRYPDENQKEMVQIAFVDYYKYMDWNIVAFIDRKELERPGFVIATRQFALLVLVSLIGIILAVFISGKIASSISRLSHYTKKIPNNSFNSGRNSELESIISNSNVDEIKQLASAFSFMEKELGQNIQDLKHHKENLEVVVSERTKELSNANAELIKKTDAAKAANKTKSEFLANMSHEIRTPLNAVLGFSDILAIEMKDPKYDTYIEGMRSAGTSLLTLLNDILDLSKIEAGKIIFDYKPVNLGTLFAEIEGIFKEKITQKGIRFIIDLAKDLPEHLILDETRIRQIIVNLIGNAAKFTDKGAIKLTAQKKDINNSDKIDLVIRVEDTGPGIEKHKLSTIFESFQQASVQINRKYGGTGLGLAICKRLAEAMNGQVSVSSKVGVGSCFKVVIEDVKISVENDHKMKFVKKSGSIRFEKKKILIVDDTESNRLILKELLVKFNLDVIEAINGREALLMAKNNHPDIIFMDIRMPVLDGDQTTKILKSKPETKHIPVIALTGDVVEKDKNGALKKGYDGFLTKPVKIPEVINELSRYIATEENKRPSETV